MKASVLEILLLTQAIFIIGGFFLRVRALSAASKNDEG
jgi:hypothetical protein